MSALRPSNLPKLAVCPCYESNPVAGPAAERGTLLDTAFRAELLGLEERFVHRQQADGRRDRRRFLGGLDGAGDVRPRACACPRGRLPGEDPQSHRHGGCHRADQAHPLRSEDRCAAQLPRADGGLRARIDGRALRLVVDGAPVVLRPARDRDPPVHLRGGARHRRSGRQIVQRSGEAAESRANTAAGAPRRIPVRRGWRWSAKH